MNKIKKLLLSKTITHSLITFSGTLVNGALGTIFFIVLARNLGPENFGLFSVSILTLTLLADIADFGINTGLINFIPKHLDSDKSRVYKFMKLGIKYKLFGFLAVLILGYLFVTPVGLYIFSKPELIPFLKLSLVGVGGALLFSFSANCLQAFQKYYYWSFLNIFINALRLLVIILLIALNVLSAESTLITYISVTFLGFFIGLLLLPGNFLKVKNEGTESKEFFSYNKWIAFSIIIAAIYSRLDTFISTRLLNISEVGYYSVAVQLTSIAPQIVYALAVVIAPKIASYSDRENAYKYFKKIQIYSLVLAAVGLLAIPLSFFIIPLLYSKAYEASVLPFIVLFIGQMFFLISTPAHQTIYYFFSKPKVMVYVSVVQLLLLTSFVFVLTSNYGIIGAAMGVTLASVFNFLVTYSWVLWQFKKR